MYHVRYFSEMLNFMALLSAHTEPEEANRALSAQRTAFLKQGLLREANSLEVKVDAHRNTRTD